jgi:hypothetical protein
MDNTPVLIRTKQDVFDLINSGRIVSRRSWLIVLIALGGTFIDAYDFTSLGIGAVQLKTQFQLSAVQLGCLTASMAIGALVGALSGGYYVESMQRKPSSLHRWFRWEAPSRCRRPARRRAMRTSRAGRDELACCA